MADPVSAKMRLGAELTKMRVEAGKPSFGKLARQAREQKVSLSSSSLSDWFNGRAVPSDSRKFVVLVRLLTKGKDPSPKLQQLYQQAGRESVSRRGIRVPSEPALAHAVTPPLVPVNEPGRRLPRIDTLHYANVPRLNHLLAAYGLPSGMQDIPAPGHRDILSLAAATESIVRRLAQVELPARRFTQDLDLRSLREGELLVFDKRVYTLNGPLPGENPSLTFDLDVDPLVYIKTRGVRIVMPYDPAFITTSTAYADFRAKHIQMVGLCVIKGRGRKTDAPHRQKLPKVQFVASPLMLGLSSPSAREPDLTEKVVFECYDEDWTPSWRGPWLQKPDAKQVG